MNNRWMITMARSRRAWLENRRFVFERLTGQAKNKDAAKLDVVDIAQRLIADINNHPSLIDGRNENVSVQIIDLAVIREALGTKWSSYAEVIHRITVRTIERHLEAAHRYTRRTDCYVLTFKGAGPQFAADRTRAICLSLATYLFGTGKNDPEPMAGRGQPSRVCVLTSGRRGLIARILDRVKAALRLRRIVTTHSVPRSRKDVDSPEIMNPDSASHSGDLTAERETGKLPTNSDGTIRPSQSSSTTDASPRGEAPDLMESCGGNSGNGAPHISIPRGEQARQSDISPASTAPRQPIKTDSDSNAQSRHSDPMTPSQPRNLAKSAGGRGALELATPAVMPVESQSPSRPFLETDTEKIKALENSILAAARRLTRDAERLTQPLPLRGLHFFYRPMWSVRTSVMAISSCAPIAILPSGEMVTGADVVPPGASLEFIQMVDHAALGHVLTDGQRLAEARLTTLVTIPIHYETLMDKDRRAAYLDRCQGLPPRARRRILFECLGIGQGTGQAEIVAGIMALKPFSALVIGGLPLDAQNFAFWKSAGLSSVGVDIHDQRSLTNRSEAELIQKLERFVSLATQSGLRPYVRGLDTLSLAAAAVAAGFDFIEGGVVQDQIEPSSVRSFTLQDLYLQFAATRHTPASTTP